MSAPTFTWAVQWMKSYPEYMGDTDVVFSVGWICSGVQDNSGVEVTAEIVNLTQVPLTQGGSFTPYDQLTQSQVLGWVWANGVSQSDTEAAVAQMIDNQITPPVVELPLPWATPAA